MPTYLVMPSHKFEDSIELGKWGEKTVKDFFVSKGYAVGQLLPVKKQLTHGYDFLVAKNGTKTPIEVKYDRRSENTGSIFWEVKVDGEPGWTQRYPENSKVKICWIFPHLGELWFFPARKLKGFDYKRFEIQYLHNPTYNAVGHRIPLVLFRNQCQVVNYVSAR